MRYSIEGQELTDIADALRRKHGETKIVTVDEFYQTIKVSKTKNATGFDSWSGGCELNSQNFYSVITIDGATTIKVKMAYHLFFTEVSEDWNQYVYIASGAHDATTFPSDALKYEGMEGGSQGRDAPIRTVELEFENTNSVTFYWRGSTTGDGGHYLGYYAEVTGLDTEGNMIGIIQPTSKDIPRVYTSAEMAQAIDDIPPVPPESAFIISGNCNYKFANSGWDWFIELYKDKITTVNITECDYMFAYSTLKNIPFDINMSLIPTTNVRPIASNIYTNAPTSLKPANMYITSTQADQMIQIGEIGKKDLDTQFIFPDENIIVVGFAYNTFNNSMMEEEPTWIFDLIDYDRSRSAPTVFGGRFPISFSSCVKLKTLPSLKKCWTNSSGYYGSFYQLNLGNCYSLQSAVLPRPSETSTETSNQFSSKFSNLYSMKHLTFDTKEDGSPYVAQWKSQVIDLNGVGAYSNSSHLDQSKKVIDEESYQRLKNDPAWYNGKTGSFEYATYNHDSAVETINSLPDTSAYLASVGGTNTIKFKGANGSLTDGGAINTLTAEEIAIATAKGWTVTLV